MAQRIVKRYISSFRKAAYIACACVITLCDKRHSLAEEIILVDIHPTNGVAHNNNFNIVQNEITMDELLR